MQDLLVNSLDFDWYINLRVAFIINTENKEMRIVRIVMQLKVCENIFAIPNPSNKKKKKKKPQYYAREANPNLSK
jgi:hypothetical protein